MKIDLKEYCERIDYRGELAPTLETLKGLHLAHATHISFENLEILLGGQIKLDLESVWTKLVTGGRGGYCYEQNGLFAAVLEDLGFRVRRLGARVRMGSKDVRPKSHMLLAVEIEGEPWLADVGFGGEGLLSPIPLQLGKETRTFAWTNRVTLEAPFHVLQTLHSDGWFDLYAFTLEEQFPADFEVANYFVSTNPHSPFSHMLFVARPGVEVRWTLMNRRLIEQRAQGVTGMSALPDDDALLVVLAERFGLHFPPGTRFRFNDSRSALEAQLKQRRLDPTL